MNKVVIGAGYGDEGKGLMVDYLCQHSKDSLVVRFNGGPQAAHTVVRNNQRHVFGVLGSGTLLGIPTYFTKDVLIDPYLLCADIIKYGFPSVFINNDCRLITPADIMYNWFSADKGTTCGMGIFTTIRRDEKVPYTLNERNSKDVIDYYSFIKDEQFQSNIQQQEMWNQYNIYVDQLREYNSTDLSQFRNYIFEGAQGLWLDEKYGTMPYCTPSNTGIENIKDILTADDEVIYVTRCYQTRHGKGPLKAECAPSDLGPEVSDLTNQYNEFQGYFRYAPLDVDRVIETIRRDSEGFQGKVSIAVTCLDQVTEIPTLNGKIKKSDFLETLKTKFYNVYASYGPTAETVVNIKEH